jgi:hypothetical protein
MNTRPTPETDEALSTAECEEDLVIKMRRMEGERDEAREELAAVIAQRDRLAEALQKVVTSWDLAEWLDENDIESFRTALQSLTPSIQLSQPDCE